MKKFSKFGLLIGPKGEKSKIPQISKNSLTFKVQAYSPSNMKNKTVKLKNQNILTNVKRSKTSQGSIGLQKYTTSISEKG